MAEDAVAEPEILRAELPARWGRGQRLKNTLLYGLIRFAFGLFQSVPQGLVLLLARPVGTLAYFAAWPETRKALQHLRASFPDRSGAWSRRTVRQMYAHFLRCVVELTHLPKNLRGLTLEDDARGVLEAAVQEGKGVVVTSGHIGNWELLAQVVAKEGFDANGIAKPLYDPRLTRWVHRLRTGHGLRIIWRGDRGGSREMLRVFKRGGVLAMLIDQDTKVQGVFVPFFGKLAHTPVAAAALALRTQAPLVVGWHHRVGGQHRFHLERLDQPKIGEGASKEELAKEWTAQITRRLQEAIEECPEQWVWMHRRWKKRPPEAGG